MTFGTVSGFGGGSLFAQSVAENGLTDAQLLRFVALDVTDLRP